MRNWILKKIIDLSQKIYNNMPVHPYDEKAVVEQNRFINKDKYSNTQVSMGMHVGSHIDAPRHLIDDGKRIDQYDLSHFMGRACVIDVFGEKIIQLKEEYKDRIRSNEIILLYTGYGDYFEKSEYYSENAPVLSKEFAEYLVKKQIKIVGMDLPSPDRYPFEVHKILLSNDVLIIENLNNLQKLLDTKHFMFYAMPLNIDAEASITRAIAVIE